MENGWVYGKSRMYGFEIKDGQLYIVPEEAEVVKHIFHTYLYDGKGCHTIANELNAAGYLSINGKMWREDGVCRLLKNDKYVGDLTQWKHYSTDFLSKKVVQNNGDNTDAPLITVTDHHEAIISREVWNGVQQQIYERGNFPEKVANIHVIIGIAVRCIVVSVDMLMVLVANHQSKIELLDA